MAEISSGDSRPLLKDLNKHIVCGLCNGYLVDATTITDCLHSFCRSCIVRQLQVSDVCPTCHKLGEVGPTMTLKSLRRDCLLQVLVYKLVPALYQREGRERRKFRRRNSRRRGDVSSSRPEDRHDGASISGSGISIRHGSVIYVDQETINLRLEPRDTNSPHHDIASDFAYGRKGTESVKHLEDTESPMTLEGTDRYFLCPGLLTIKLLKKFMRYKFSLEDNCQIDLFYCEEPLLDSYTLADLGYIFWSEKTTCMTIQYVIWKRISNDLYVSDTLLNKENPDCVTECQDQADQSVSESVSDGEKVSVEGESYQNGDGVAGTNGDRVTEKNSDMVAECDVSSTSVVLQIDDVGHVDCLSESMINVCDKVNSVNDVILPSVLKVDQNNCLYNSEFVHGVSSNNVSSIGQAVYETGLHGQFQLETLKNDSHKTAPIDEQRESCENSSLDRLAVSEECVVTSRIGTGTRACGPSTQHLTASSKHLHSGENFFCAKRHKGESSQFPTKNDKHTEKVLATTPLSCGDPTNTQTNNVCITLGNFCDSSHEQGDPQNSTNDESARNSLHSNAFHGLFAINPSWVADRSDKNHNICREQHRQSDVKPTDIDCVDVCCDGEMDDDDDNHDPHPIDDDRNDREGSVEVHEAGANEPSDVVYNRVQDMGISTSPMFCEDEQIQHCLENLDVISNSNSSSSADFSLNDIVDISRFSSQDLCQNSSSDMEFNHFEALARNNAKERYAVESIEQIHSSNETVRNSGSLDALDTNARSPGLTGGYGEQQYTAAKDGDSCVSPILVIDSEKISKKSVTWNLSEEPSESEHTGFNDGESSSIVTTTPSSSCDSQASVATQTAPDLICRYFSRRTAPLGLYSCNKKNSPKVSKPQRKTGLSSKFYQSSKTGNSDKNTLKMTQPGFTITSQSNVFPNFNSKNAFVITFPGNTTSMLSDNCRPRVTLFGPSNGNVATVLPVTPPLTPVNQKTDGQTIGSNNSLSVPIRPASTGINPVVSGRNGVKSRSSGVNVTPNLAKLLPAPIVRESRPSAVLSSAPTSVYTFNDNIGQNKPESDRLYARGTKGGKNSKCTTQDTAPTPTTVINICQNGIQTTPNLPTADNGPRRPTIIFLPPMASSNACNPSNAIAVLLPVSSSANNINAPRFNATNNVQTVNTAPSFNANNINAPRLDGINSVHKVNIAPALNANNINAPRLDAINRAEKVNIAPAIGANNIQGNCKPLVRNTDASKPEMSPTKTATEARFRIQQTSSAQTVGPVTGVSSQCVNQARATVFMNNSVLGKDKIGQGCITRTPAPPVPLNNGIVKNFATNGEKNQLEPILCVNKTSQRERVNKPKKKVRFDIDTEDNMLGSPEVPEKLGTPSVNAELNDNTTVLAESMEKGKFSLIKGLPILSSIINSDVIDGIGNKQSEIKLSVANVGSGGNVIVTSCKEKQACPTAFVSTNEMSQFLQKALIQQNVQRLMQATPEHLQRSVPSKSFETQSVIHTSQETDHSGSPQNFGNMNDQQQAFEQTKSPPPSSDQKSTLSWTEIDRQEMLSAAKHMIKPCSVALPKKVYAYLGSAMSHEHIARERDSPTEATQNLLKNIDNSPTQDKTSLYLPPADQLEMSEPSEAPQPINQLRLMCKELQNTIPPSPDDDASLKSGRSPSGRRTRKRKSCTNCCQPVAKLTNSDRKVARC